MLWIEIEKGGVGLQAGDKGGLSLEQGARVRAHARGFGVQNYPITGQHSMPNMRLFATDSGLPNQSGI